MSKQVYEFSDKVSMRLVQIFQEALMLGRDGADLLRQVRLEVSDEDPATLVLTDAYVDQVKAAHKTYLEQADLQALRDA